MKTIVTVLILFISVPLFGQSYTVIHTIGKILDTSTNTYLKKGSKLNESAKLTFETKGARAAVLSSSRGRFIVQETSSSGSQSDLAYTLSSVIAPVRGRLSTRAGAINNQLDFEKHFSDGPIAIVGGSYQVDVSETAYPVNTSRFFYAQYSYNGERINKKLGSVEGVLVFEASTLYSVDGNSVDAAATSDGQLYYFDSDKSESTLVTTYEFNVVSSDDLKSLLETLNDLFWEDRIDALHEIVTDLFGKCAKESIRTEIESFK